MNDVNVIYKGTTPTLEFYCDFDTNLIGEDGKVRITFSQQKIIVFIRDEDTIDIDTECDTMSLTLTQEETLMLKKNIPIQIQIDVKLESGVVMCSDIMIGRVGETLNTEVM